MIVLTTQSQLSESEISSLLSDLSLRPGHAVVIAEAPAGLISISRRVRLPNARLCSEHPRPPVVLCVRLAGPGLHLPAADLLVPGLADTGREEN